MGTEDQVELPKRGGGGAEIRRGADRYGPILARRPTRDVGWGAPRPVQQQEPELPSPGAASLNVYEHLQHVRSGRAGGKEGDDQAALQASPFLDDVLQQCAPAAVSPWAMPKTVSAESKSERGETERSRVSVSP